MCGDRISTRSIRPDQDILVREMYLSGVSVADIVREHGFNSTHPVWNSLKRTGTPLRPKQKMKDEQSVVDSYNSGDSIYKIAEMLGMTPTGIYALLKRNNVVCRDKRRTTDSEEEELVAEYSAGGTLDSVGENWGIERTTVHHILIRHGVDRHPCSVSTHTINEHIFDSIDNEISAYLLGQVYADGCVGMDKFTLSIGLSEKDHDYLDMLRTLYDTDFDIKTYMAKNGKTGKCTPACRLSMYSVHMASRLRDIGIVPRRGQFSKTLEALHPSVYSHFVRGFYDGDGSIDWRVAKNRITPNLRVRFLGQLDILSWIKGLLARETETNSRTSIFQRTGIMGLDYGGGILGYKIASWIYKDATIFLKRKHDRYIEYKTIRGW